MNESFGNRPDRSRLESHDRRERQPDLGPLAGVEQGRAGQPGADRAAQKQDRTAGGGAAQGAGTAKGNLDPARHANHRAGYQNQCIDLAGGGVEDAVGKNEGEHSKSFNIGKRQ